MHAMGWVWLGSDSLDIDLETSLVPSLVQALTCPTVVRTSCEPPALSMAQGTSSGAYHTVQFPPSVFSRRRTPMWNPPRPGR